MNIECRSFRKGSSAFIFSFFLILLCFFSHLFWRGAGGEVSAQVVDSIRVSFQKKPKLIGGLNAKNTFINGFRSPIYTASVGLDFNHTVRVGAGYSVLRLSNHKDGTDNTPFYLDKTIKNISGIDTTVHPELQFSYINLFFEYVYFKSKKWQFSVPLQVGIGGSSYKYNFNGEKITEDRHTILLYEPTVSGQYKIIKWFGVKLDVGYRIMLISNKNIGVKFNSPIYNAGVIIYWGELYRMVAD